MKPKDLRRSKKMKLKDVARQLGLSSQTLSNYENCKRKFPSKLITPYANALNVSVNTVLDCFKK